MVRMLHGLDGDDGATAEMSELKPGCGAARHFAESGGVWFTGLPRVGRWKRILGRYETIRAHADDPMRVTEFTESGGCVRALCVEIVDRRADTVIRVRHTGAPFAIKSGD